MIKNNKNIPRGGNTPMVDSCGKGFVLAGLEEYIITPNAFLIIKKI